MPRLLAFGCSYTFGSAMPDAWPMRGDLDPSRYAWPELLSQRLNYEPVNLAKGGAGNLEILWEIMSTDFKSDDLVIIMWTHFTRLNDFVFVEPGTGDTFLELGHKKTAKKGGYRVPMSARILKGDIGYDLANKNYLLMNHGSLFLKDKGLKSYHFLATNEYVFPRHNNIVIENFLDIKPVDWQIDTALDNMHPGVESQKLLASLIYDKIKEYELR